MTAAAIRAAYEASADAWAAGPDAMYTELARAMLAAAPVPVRGTRVLDIGAGTGVAGRAAVAAGARMVVATDLAAEMLRHCPPPLHRAVADLTALPFGDGSFDLVTAAFCLSHLDKPLDGLREARRVGAALLASAFQPGWEHPAKSAVDAVLTPLGYVPPAWYAGVKGGGERLVGDPRQLADLATAAGYAQVQIHELAVSCDLLTSADLVAWRLGMAHVAPFVQSLDDATRAAVRREAELTVADAGRLVAPMIVLAAV